MTEAVSTRPFQILSSPMQGYTENAFRTAHASAVGGTDEYFIPFARLEKDRLRTRDLAELDPQRNPDSAVPQILVSTPEETEKICRLVSAFGYRRIDLNFGCPFVKVSERGYGCGILADPERAEAVLSVLSTFPEIRFSLKMRSGFHSPQDWEKLIPALNAAPLLFITLHPRSGDDGYSGSPSLDVFTRFRTACRIPVFWNGDLHTVSDVSALRARFPDLPGVSLGRGLLADVLLPLKIKDCIFDPERTLKLFHHVFSEALAKEEQPLAKLKIFWEYFLPDAPKKFRKKLQKSRSWEEALAAAEICMNSNFKESGMR